MPSIPNNEMFIVFVDEILIKLDVQGMTRAIRVFSKSILSENMEAISRSLENLLMLAVNFKILDDEHLYQAFLTGLPMNFLGNYRITADHESGRRYYDICLERIRGADRTLSSRSNVPGRRMLSRRM